jgi:hypothetical protein
MGKRAARGKELLAELGGPLTEDGFLKTMAPPDWNRRPTPG